MNIDVVEERIRVVDARSATDLAAELTRLIRSGDLAEGDRLPTIRRVADILGVSVGTVADAWATLRSQRLIETRRRGGTRVTGLLDQREFAGWEQVDFLLSSPDGRLQPSLEGAFLHALRQPRVNAWGRESMIPALEAAIAPRWPFAAEAYTTAGGGTEGLWLATAAARQGARPIAVEEPAPPGFLALLAAQGIEVIGVAVDAEGPIPDAVAVAARAGAGTLVHQPGGPFSHAHVLSAARVEQLAAVIRPTDLHIVEDDSLGLLSPVSVRTLGEHFPDRTVRVLSFCKAFGLDLRTSVLGGARALIDRAERARSAGIASNSRILQYALAALLTDTEATERVRDARAKYAVRRALAITAFTDAGLAVLSGPGSHVLWVEVPDERTAALSLATRGIVVEGASSAHSSALGDRDMLRVSIMQIPESPSHVAELADTFVRASTGDLRVRFD